jgi:LuxR family maltose regulon positive regulatory protein
MQGQADTGSFIKTFTGSHRFVLDYLVEEVLHQQPPAVQHFLLRTSILNRMCGPLCDTVVRDLKLEIGRLVDPQSPVSNLQSQSVLEYLEQANLFIVPLDNERRWYRYHHLFGELLRQRLPQSLAASAWEAESAINQLHLRASQWFEDHGLALEAFHHATAANDVERAERLIESDGMQLHLRGAVLAILQWLESLPTAVLQARPWLWWRHAALLLVNGHTSGVEEKLQAAEAALQSPEWDERLGDKTRNLVGRIATARAVLALTRYQVEPMLVQSRRALEYLHPDNLTARANANWTLGFAHFLRGDRAAARQAYSASIALGQTAGDVFTTILATIGLGTVQEVENQLHLAAQTYREVLQVAGDQPLQIINEAHLGLARVLYEWNDLAAAEQHARQSHYLARQYERIIDRFIVCEVFLARLHLAQGDVAGAVAQLAQAEQAARQQNFVLRLPEVAAAQVLLLLRQGNLSAAAQLAQRYDLPLSQTRVHLAQGDPAAALRVLEPVRQRAMTKGWADERLRVLVLQALAYQAQGDKAQALQVLGEALALTAAEGFIRTFVDEGLPMLRLLSAAAAQGIRPDHVGKLLAAFAPALSSTPIADDRPPDPASQLLIEPLSERELEVLQLIAQGLSNQEICARLFLALSTVKGHNQRIFAKLQVQRRTEAVARARELGLV